MPTTIEEDKIVARRSVILRFVELRICARNIFIGYVCDLTSQVEPCKLYILSRGLLSTSTRRRQKKYLTYEFQVQFRR